MASDSTSKQPHSLELHIPGFGFREVTFPSGVENTKIFWQHYHGSKACLKKRPSKDNLQPPPPIAGPSGSVQSPHSSTESLRDQLQQSLALSDRPSHCYGVTVQWEVGAILTNYAWAVHDIQKMGYEPVGFDRKTDSIVFQSERCKGPELNDYAPHHCLNDGSYICEHCRTIPTSRRFRKLVNRVVHRARKHTPYGYLSFKQALDTLSKANKHIAQLQSKVQVLEKHVKHLTKKVDDYTRILILLAKNDVSALRRLLSVALKHGASPHMVLRRLEDALNGLYRVRGGFDQQDLDKAFLAKALGGSRLLYALTKSEAYASKSTLNRHYKPPKLIPSLDTPSTTEISANISAFFHPDVKQPPSFPSLPPAKGLPGNILMFDGVAIEPRCRYCPKQNAVMGLCREHSRNVKSRLNVTNLGDVEAIRDALFDEKKQSNEKTK
ncbi:hypothetical protein PQX77_001996, partial [Marasmius sp. AFHP31]